ncbi:MAG: c-type cytochrome [Nitrospirae bacterium]|nr:c-type cytochrome [Nitrospirota bacterium]
MHRRFYLKLLLVSSIALLAFALLAAYKEINPEWKHYQNNYKELFMKNAKDEAMKEKAKAFKVEVQQLYIEKLNRADRCVSCHIGVENPMMAKAEAPYKKHSGDYLGKHPLSRFGCTACHQGQGRATNKEEAHALEHDTHWEYPIVPLKHIQSSCAQCHDYAMLEKNGADKVVRGRKLFLEKGCLGCHKVDGAGGILGKALDGIGTQPRAYFPMRYIQGERTQSAWHKEHFLDPRAIVPESEMKASINDEEADFLATYILALKSTEMPREYRRIRQTETPDMSGEALYKKYCIGCHTTGRESYFDEIFNRTIPSIMNPALLKSADNQYLKKIVSEGREGTQMTSWKPTAAGLTEQEIDMIVEYISKDRPAAKPEPFDVAKFRADVKRGGELFNIRCALCHGKKGEGELGINLKNPVVQSADPEFLAVTVRDGRAGTPMPPFGKDGVGLKEQEIADIVSYVKTLSQKKL